jgi:predicted RNA methylase
MIQTTGLTRNTIDKYYTKPIIVAACIQAIKEHIKISAEHDTIIEPSAGNGAFIDGIKTLSKNTIFYDLEPESPQIIKQDYLQLIYDKNKTKTKEKVHVIGNPPFGRQSSLAIKFIKKSTEFCDSLSFILPKSFKKDSMKKSFPPNFHMVYESDISDNAFLVGDKEHNVPCVFQIWEKREEPRQPVIKQEPINYTFVKQSENPDISFRRVGVYAGKIDKEYINKSPQSHYFIKFSNENMKEADKEILYDRMIKLKFDCKNNTVGPRSISKQELIAALNPLFT